jgi:dimethylargininase
VLRVGRTLYVGLSTRTNREAIAELETLLSEWDYEVSPVPLHGCLHLKSAVTQVGEHLLLLNDRMVGPECFGPIDRVTVDPQEPDSANALWIARGGGGAVVYPAHYPRTAERLDRAGVRVVEVSSTEVAKAEGGVTCCSLVFSS